MNSGQEAFEHRTRKLVYNYILSHSGVTFGAIEKIFDMNVSTLKYHLRYLERGKHIFSRREGRNRCYYVDQSIQTGINPFPRANPYTLTKTQTSLIKVIQNEPGISFNDLSMVTKLDQRVLTYNIKRLGDLNLIWVAKANGVVGYEYVTEDKLRDEIFNRLVNRLISDEIDEQTFLKIKRKLEDMDIKDIM